MCSQACNGHGHGHGHGHGQYFLGLLVNQKLTHFIKLVLVKDDVEHLGRTLGELLSGHQLHIDVPRLRLSSEHGGHADADGDADADADVLMVLVMLMLMVLMLIPSPGT